MSAAVQRSARMQVRRGTTLGPRAGNGDVLRTRTSTIPVASARPAGKRCRQLDRAVGDQGVAQQAGHGTGATHVRTDDARRREGNIGRAPYNDPCLEQSC